MSFENLLQLINTNQAELEAAYNAAKGKFPNATQQGIIQNYVLTGRNIVQQFTPKAKATKPAPKPTQQPEVQPDPEKEDPTNLLATSKKNEELAETNEPEEPTTEVAEVMEGDKLISLEQSPEEIAKLTESNKAIAAFLATKPTKKEFVSFMQNRNENTARIEATWKHRDQIISEDATAQN